MFFGLKDMKKAEQKSPALAVNGLLFWLEKKILLSLTDL